MNKPSTCEGCPLFETSVNFCPDEVIEMAEVLIVALKPTLDDTTVNRPLAKDSLLETTYFPVADLFRRENVSFAHIIRCSWPGPTKLPRKKDLELAALHCRQYDMPMDDFKIIVALDKRVWKFFDEDSDASFRGFTI